MSENAFSLLESHAREHPGARVLVWEGGELTWKDLELRVGGCARRLAALGVGAGDRVAIVTPSDWRFVVALLAVLKIGATATPLNPRLTAAERSEILADLAPRLVIDDVAGDEATWPTAAPVDAPALILYTSGTTGRPKGVLLSHAAVVFANRSWAGPVMALTPDDVVLAALPLAHSLGLNGALLAPLIAGARVVLLERFAPETVARAIARYGVTVLPGVATMFRRLLESPVLADVDLSSLRLAVSGAAPCPWELAERWRRRTGVRILRGYGMTELFRPISYLANDSEDLPEAIGRPVPGVDVLIVDDDDRPVVPDEVGELIISTPCAMEGYFRAPDATADVMRGKWFRTGDLARQTADGYVCIVGRKRELILRGGYSVNPTEVERVLAGHPAIAEAAVVGRPHEELGEEVVAFVAFHAGRVATAEALVEYCKDRLASYKYPRSVIVVERLPRSATGKVLKSELVTAR